MSSNKFNPFYDRLVPLHAKRRLLEIELSGKQSELDTLLGFDYQAALAAIESNTATADRLTKEAAALKKQLDQANARIGTLKAALNAPTQAGSDAPAVLGGALIGSLAAAGIGGIAGIGLRVLGTVAGLSTGGATGYQFFKVHQEKSARKRALAEAEHQRNVLAAAFDTLADDANRILGENAARLRVLKERQDYDPEPARSSIAALTAQLSELDNEIGVLENRRATLDKQLADLPSEIEREVMELGRLKDVHGQLKQLDQTLKSIDGRTKEAGYRRAMLHSQVHTLRGTSADKADYGSDAEFKRAGNPVIQAQAVMAEINARTRQVRKKVERANELKKQAELTVKTIVLDGNNLCYERSGGPFIGICAAQAVSAWLVTHRKDIRVHVVFDPGILTRLTQISFDAAGKPAMRWQESDLRKAFKGCQTVTIVRGSADKTLLPAAHEPDSYVISNDRYGEFGAMAAVRDGRIFRFNILNGTVTVPQLDLVAFFADSTLQR
ncbi:hypothetical protein [Pseudoxanthomonas mexicana]